MGQLRQNPTAALDAVENGETFIVTRHRREIGRLVPPVARRPVSADDYRAAVSKTPIDNGWAAEVGAARDAADAGRDPWTAAR